MWLGSDSGACRANPHAPQSDIAVRSSAHFVCSLIADPVIGRE